MIALCLADLHSNVTALRRLEALLTRERGTIDLVLAAGDITIPGHEAYAQDFIDVVRRQSLPLLLVHGNNDTYAAVETFRRENVTIHRRERSLGEARFVGFGGDGSALHDQELADGETLELRLGGAVLLTHLPPQARLTYSTREEAARAAVQSENLSQPRAHVCGHIHQTEGVAYLGATKVVKLRAAMWNRCALLDVKTLSATFRDLESSA